MSQQLCMPMLLHHQRGKVLTVPAPCRRCASSMLAAAPPVVLRSYVRVFTFSVKSSVCHLLGAISAAELACATVSALVSSSKPLQQPCPAIQCGAGLQEALLLEDARGAQFLANTSSNTIHWKGSRRRSTTREPCRRTEMMLIALGELSPYSWSVRFQEDLHHV